MAKTPSPNRQERIAALMIGNALGATGGKMIVAGDEADDLFAGVDEENAATRHGSKVFMNRLVEHVAGPTIWIVNDIDRLGPAVVRRMNLVMRFPAIPLKHLNRHYGVVLHAGDDTACVHSTSTP